MTAIDPILALREALFEVEQRLEDIAKGRAFQPVPHAAVGLTLARHANEAVSTLIADLSAAQSQIAAQAAEIAQLRKATADYRDASGHLVQLYMRLHAGRPVRDLEEAMAIFAATASALDALTRATQPPSPQEESRG